MGPDIYNVQTIEKGQLSVMAKPVSGEWIEEEFSQISNYGIKKIVSLLEIAEERTVGLSDEKTLSEKNNMSFVSFPISIITYILKIFVGIFYWRSFIVKSIRSIFVGKNIETRKIIYQHQHDDKQGKTPFIKPISNCSCN